MRHSTARFARKTAFLCGLTFAVPLLLLLPGQAMAVHSFDPFDHATFPGLDASGNLGFTGVGTGVYQTPSFDTDLYTYSDDATPVANEERDLTGCGISPGVFHFGSKTAWVRFIPTTTGTAKVTVAPNGYNVMVWLYNLITDARAPGLYTFEGIKNKQDCRNISHPGNESETIEGKVQAGTVVFIQTASFCAAGAMASACGAPAAAAGGPTTVRLEFTPDNADGDGVPDTLDACPSVKGNPPNGCPPLDADHDGATIATDCNDSNPAIHPGAPPIPGNGVDDDCDGKPEAYGVMLAEVTLSFRDTRRGIRVRSLVLRNVTGGGRVEVSCKRGRRRACRKQVRKSGAHARASSTVRLGRLSGRRLRAGTKVEIRITKKNSVGRYVRYRIRRAGFKRTDGCMKPGSRKPRRSCAMSAL